MKKLKYTYALLSFFFCASKVALASAPNWSVNPAAFQYNMTLTAVANMHCADLQNPANIIAAFSGNQCRGIAATAQIVNQKYLASLFIYSNQVSGDSLHFKIYNATTDSVYDAKITLLFTQNASYGTALMPYSIFTNQAPTSLTISHHKIHENAANGDYVADLSAIDPDPADQLSFAFVAGTGSSDNDAFEISSTTLRIKNIDLLSHRNAASIRVRVSDQTGCSFEKELSIQVVSKNVLPCSNLVTPNGDGKNDYFTIDDPSFFAGYTLHIFNEAGVDVFSSDAYQNTWDGSKDGNTLPSGAYYYSFKNDAGNEYKGIIQLITNR